MAYPLLESNIGKTIITNHRLFDIDSPEVLALESKESETQYYEVVRCIDGIPLFIEDHLDRLQSSIRESIACDRIQLCSDVDRLIESNGIVNGNIRIVLTRTVCLLYANQFYYPSLEEYSTGVPIGLLQWKRTDPNVKSVREDYKSAVQAKLSQASVYGAYFETLLADGGFVTEGSRSNVFFIKGNQVLTAPDEYILKGITRKYVLDAIQKAGAGLLIKKIPAADMDDPRQIEAAFLSGTSIGVLPICAIEETRFSSAANDMVLRIRAEYDRIIEDYLIKSSIHTGGLERL